MKIIENNVIPPRGFKAITLGSFIFVRKGTILSEQDINHEAIHWEQYKETFVIGFFFIYLFEFILKFISPSLTVDQKRFGRSYWKRVYRSLSMEREAYNNQDNSNYIKSRQHYAWIKHIL